MAIGGAVAGLALVVIQRFVKVDLLGFCGFGTIMLLVSAAFLALQDDYWHEELGTDSNGRRLHDRRSF